VYKKGKPIIVVGSLNMDVLVKAEKKPVAGQSVLGTHFGLYPGGKGANQAVQAARLGAKVYMVGRVGKDQFGDQLVKNLRDSGVHVNYIQRDAGGGTGMGCVIADSDGNNWIVTIPRANLNWHDEDIKRIEPIVQKAGCLVLQLEIPIAVACEAVSIAHRSGTPVILNPSPAQALPEELFPKIDLLLPNETEAEFYSGIKIVDIESAKKAAQFLLGKGPRQVIITLGKNGAVFTDNGNVTHYPSFDVRAVDPTAAGDAFCGALATALVEGLPILSAMQLASAAGAYSVTRLGAQTSLGTSEELQNFMKQNAVKVSP
jgi:ribokinase